MAGAQAPKSRETPSGGGPITRSVSHYPPGQAPQVFTPGDFSLHRASTGKGRGGATTALGKLIQAGERRRYGNSDFARWTHSTLIVSDAGDICEAIEAGVAERNLERYRNSDYMIVHVAALPSQRDLAVGFARSRVGDHYGVLNFVALGFQALFGWTVSLHMDTQFICSGLVARATEKYIDAYPRSPENMMPADLAAYWGAQSGEPPPAPGFLGRLLDLLGTLVDLFRRRGGDPAPDPGRAAPDAPPGRAPNAAPDRGQPGAAPTGGRE